MTTAIQISENFIKGEPITTTEQLIRLAYEKKSIYHTGFKIKPAAVIINMNFMCVMQMINRGMLHETIKLVKLKTNKK